MADSDFSVYAKINADTSNFDKGMKNAQKSATSLSDTFSSLQTTINKVFTFAGLAVGTKALVDFGKKAVSAADQANKAFSILSNTIKVTGASAWTSDKEMEKMAKNYAKTTNYSVTEIEKMQSVLLGFRDITGDTFEDASDAILDMATVMGMDLTSAVQTVGKALDDPVKGLDSLRRQGFAFTDEQKKMLEALVKTGDKMKAQQIILQELSTTYGGAARMGQSAFAQLQHSMDELYETVGNKLMPTIESAVRSLAKMTEKITDFLSSADFDNFITIMVGLEVKVKTILFNIQGYFSNVFTEIKSIIHIVDFSPFISVLDTLVGVVKGVVEQIKKQFELVRYQFETIKSSLNISETIDFSKISKVINKVIDVFWYLYDEIFEITLLIKKIIFDKIIEIWEKIKEIFNNSQNALAQSETDIKSWGDFIYTTLNNVFRIVQDLIGSVKAILNGDWALAWEYAKLTVMRVADNILTIFSTIANAFPSLINKMVDMLNVLIEKINIVRGWLKLEPIDLLAPFESVDLSKKTGLETKIEEIETKIKNMSGKAADIMIKDLNGISDKSKGSFKEITDDIKDTGETVRKESKKTRKQITNDVENVNQEITGVGGFFSDFKAALADIKKELQDEASSWTDFFVDAYHSIKELGVDAIEAVGASLVEGQDAWKALGATALETIAEILEGLAAELAARAALAAAAYNYAGAVAAAAGATAALVGAGALKAVASQMKSVADSAAQTDTSMQNVKATIDGIKGSVVDFSSFTQNLIKNQKLITDLSKEYGKQVYAGLQKEIQRGSLLGQMLKDTLMQESDYYNNLLNSSIEEINELIELQEFSLSLSSSDPSDKLFYSASYYENKKQLELLKSYKQAYETFNSLASDTVKAFKEANEELIYQIKMMETFLTQTNTDSNFGKIIGENIKNGILNSVYEARNELISMGSELSEILFSSISDGATQTSFLTDMKKYIKDSILKLTVYTESFAESMTSISKKIISAIYSGDTDLAKTAKTDIKKLWDETKKAVKEAENFVNSIFDEIQDNAEDLIESIEDMTTSIADEIVSALDQGLGQGDFMETMKKYIKKMVIQTVVYTESLKSEIEAIGKAISTGIAEGFTETGLHEIKRDLSYIFDQASRAIDKVDNLFDTVFSGYASGTQNATSGIHLVGEAGPELVKFRGGEQVLNAQNTNKALEGMGTINNWNVTFNNLQDTSAFTIMQQLKEYNRQMAIDGIF